jgi:crotonobetainyl-CoA:carnitine CoA-transferase CaiB-like acyl-CoA transferase
VSLGVVQPAQFAALATWLGRDDWLADPRFATPDARRAHFDAMHDELASEIARHDGAALEGGMSAHGIPCGLVRSVDEAAALAGPGALLPLSITGLPDGETLAIPNAGFRMSEGGPGTTCAPPRLDEHRAEILAWLEQDGD